MWCATLSVYLTWPLSPLPAKPTPPQRYFAPSPSPTITHRQPLLPPGHHPNNHIQEQTPASATHRRQYIRCPRILGSCRRRRFIAQDAQRRRQARHKAHIHLRCLRCPPPHPPRYHLNNIQVEIGSFNFLYKAAAAELSHRFSLRLITRAGCERCTGWLPCVDCRWLPCHG